MIDPRMFYMDPLRVQITAIHIMDTLFEYIKEKKPYMLDDYIDDMLLLTQIAFCDDGHVEIINKRLVEGGEFNFADFKIYYMQKTRDRSARLMKERMHELRN